MPKILTMAERRASEQRRFNRQQDNNVRIVLLQAKKTQKLTYNEIAQKANVGVSTVQKALDVSKSLDSIELDKLRKVGFALGVSLKLCAEFKN